MAASRDYYELLDVPKTAAYEDIKTAYKRQALQWHPDKNSDRLDEATERFKAINEAYKVLSDPRERAWYDTHKDQILSGESEDSGINLWPYFSPSAYPAGYTDEPEGFYAVFREVFETLSREENTQASDKSDIQQRPGFGDSTTPIEQVSDFYNYWTNFTTIKKFFWADKYDLRDGEHRRIRRLMEAENKKERGREKRAYVEMVRELAEHVKRRDPRWTEYQTRLKVEREAKQAAEMQQKQEESKRLKELKEQFRREEAERYKREYEEMRRKQIEEEGGEGASDDAEEEEEEPFFCEPCKKTFSTEKQLHNHEQSKKHKQKVQQIRAEVSLPEEQPEVVKKPPPPKPSKVKEVPKAPEEEVKATPEQESSSEDEEEEPVASRFMMRRKETSDDEDEPPVPQPKGKKPAVESKPPQEEQKKVGKAKLKRQKKSEKAAGPGMCCNICGLKFETRNKLFTHIKETGHAATR